MLTLLLRLFGHVERRRRYQFAMLFGLTSVTSVAEVISLSAVVPFIAVLTQPARALAADGAMASIVHSLGISPQNPAVLITVAFAAAAIVAGVLRLVLLSFSIRLTNATGADLSLEVYRRTLYQPYAVHIGRSSSEVIAGITQKVTTAAAVLMSLVTVVTSTALLVSILLTLLAIEPAVSSLAMLTFGAGYGFIAWQTRQRLSRNSDLIAREQTSVVRALQEGLGAIRDVLLDGTQRVHCAVYDQAIQKLRLATGENSYINQAPRFAMESLAMALVALFALFAISRGNALASALPVMGALALGAQRLLPLLQQLYGNWAVVAGSRGSLIDVLQFLEQPLPPDAHDPPPPPLTFVNAIAFRNIRFRYSPTSAWVLDGINLEIRKGSRVGLVGSTGSGKTTTLDLVMGLLEPTEGEILVDGELIDARSRRAWQRNIAHVPQSIYLADATVAENIAFGVPPDQIDMARVRDAARQAQIAEFVASRPEGYGALVGERGVRLSGGQRQRIGIARALYKQASVLVFDEATSALDAGTEDAVIGAIEGLSPDLTVLMVAHRPTTLRSCDTILHLERGQIVGQFTYADYHASSIMNPSHSRVVDRNAPKAVHPRRG